MNTSSSYVVHVNLMTREACAFASVVRILNFSQIEFHVIIRILEVGHLILIPNSDS